MCLSLLYPNSMLCKSFNKKRRFKNKLFFLLWIENISNNNRKSETFLYFCHKDVVGVRQNPSICQFYKNKVGKLSDIINTDISPPYLTLGSKIADKKNTTVSVYLLARKKLLFDFYLMKV